MIEAFIKVKPTSKDEFLANIPLRLRENTDGLQSRQFLNDILQIIEEYV